MIGSQSKSWLTVLIQICVLFLCANHPVRSDEFESYPVINSNEILPQSLLHSVYHRVESIEFSDRFYQFEIESEFSRYNVTSLALAKERIYEIKTLAEAINQYESKDNRLSGELRSQFSVSGDSAMDILTSPFSTVSKLAGQAANNLGDTFAGVDVLAENSQFRYTDRHASDSVAEQHKRIVASQLGLDVYSTNSRVQAFLNTVAKAREAGRISAGVTLLSPQRVSSAKRLPLLEHKINSNLKNRSVLELYKLVKNNLINMKVGNENRNKFLINPVLTPRHQLTITTYLSDLHNVEKRNKLIETISGITSESMVLSYERLAKSIAFYQNKIEKLRYLHIKEGMTGAITKSGRLVYFDNSDLVDWTKENKQRFSSLAKHAKTSGYDSLKAILLGKTTPTARRHLISMGFILEENYLGDYL